MNPDYGQARPSAIFKPTLTRASDGIWWAHYPYTDPSTPIEGHGCSPEDAMRQFDINWTRRTA